MSFENVSKVSADAIEKLLKICPEMEGVAVEVQICQICESKLEDARYVLNLKVL
jgi:hypothetical protein